jgi:hypothetical protein
LNYNEKLTFTKFQGAQLLDPYEGNTADVLVPPAGEETVIVKLGAAWGLSYKMGMKIYS